MYERCVSHCCRLRHVQIYKFQSQFNQRLLHLRDEKIGIISEIGQLIVHLERLQQRLPPDKRIVLPHCPQMAFDEIPERSARHRVKRWRLLSRTEVMNTLMVYSIWLHIRSRIINFSGDDNSVVLGVFGCNSPFLIILGSSSFR